MITQLIWKRITNIFILQIKPLQTRLLKGHMPRLKINHTKNLNNVQKKCKQWMNWKSKGSEWDLGWHIHTEGSMRGYTPLKSSEFTTVGHVWPCLCGLKGTFLKVLAMRRNLTTGCPGRAQVQEPRQRRAPQLQPGGDTGVAAELWAGLSQAPLLTCPESENRKQQSLVSRTFPIWGPLAAQRMLKVDRQVREQEGVYLPSLSD